MTKLIGSLFTNELQSQKADLRAGFGVAPSSASGARGFCPLGLFSVWSCGILNRGSELRELLLADQLVVIIPVPRIQHAQHGDGE